MSLCFVLIRIQYNIDISRCRGQGFNNGSNVSGRYKGVQTLILEKNPQAIFAPCRAHTLNLCGVHAVEVAREIKSFFGHVQKLYNLFSGSPARWKILKENAGVSLHSLSDTRWSPRIDAVRILVENHIKMLEILSNIQTDLDLTDLAFSDAENLLEWMKSFEYILMATFWFKVLQCIDDVNKVLQYADISIADELEHLSSLQNEIQNLRDSWEIVLQKAKLVSSSLGQSTTLKENRSHTITAEENFKINIYYKALDSLLVQLSERFKVVDALASRFEFIVNPPADPSTDVVQEQAKRLADSYPSDVMKDELEEELRHFIKFFQVLGTSSKRNRALDIINHTRRSLNAYTLKSVSV